MMTNLFSIFDPSTSINNSMNWASLAIWMILMPMTMWVIPNRYSTLMKTITFSVMKEFKPLIKKAPQTLIIMLSLFMVIMMNNALGLLPFIFTATSHMSITLTLALPLWLGMMAHSWTFNTSNMLIHLIPNNTPTILMPFMVIIETISNIIRPLTLSIRLAANMIAGHLLITLLTSANPITPLYAKWITLSAQLMLGSLELAVAFIQAYVFSVLLTLYVAESVS